VLFSPRWPTRAGPTGPARRPTPRIGLRRALGGLGVLGAAGVLGAVSLSLPLTPIGAAGAPAPAPAIAWAPCPTTPGYRCGALRVPLDYGHPTHGAVALAVMEHVAPHGRGVVVFNPGGPGESGVSILPLEVSWIPAAVRDHLTLVSFDERGTGASDPLLCGPSPGAAASATAGTPSGTRVFAGLARACRSAYPALFPTVTTTTSARDMDRLRQALGVDRIDYYGTSYGSVLGTVYRQLFPAHVRSMVLDGAVDSNLTLTVDADLEAPAIQAALDHDLTACSAAPGCPLGADPVGFYRSLQHRLAQAPLPAPGGGDTTPVTEGDLDSATLLYLSVPALTPGFLPALVSAAAGDGAPLRSVALTLETDLDGKSLVGPLWTIQCSDAVAHPNGATTAALARSLDARYPLGGAEAVANNLIGCPGWAGSGGPVAPIEPVKAPTALVIGNTGDPNTPYASARLLASAIRGRLVTYIAYSHSWLLNGNTDACMQAVVGSYLAAGTLPAAGTRCGP